MEPTRFTFEAIGVARTPYGEKVEAPRQGVASAVEGTIELFPGHDYEHALEDLEGWERLWIVFVFDRVTGWRPKVLPPRSEKRRGVFATRSPHRPNPIGLTTVELLAVEGLVLRVRGIDLLDGTPVLDLKPYVPYADAFPGAMTGWLAPLALGDRGEVARDPEPGFEVRYAALARAQLDFLKNEHGIELESQIGRTLSLGPQPHPYRRIRKEGEGYRLATKEWRVHFRLEGRVVTVERLATGYRKAELAANPALAAHRAFVMRFLPGA